MPVSASCQALPLTVSMASWLILLSTFSSSSAQHSLHFGSAQHISLLPDPDPLKPFISLGEEFVVDRGPSAATYQESTVSLSCISPRDWTSSAHIPEHLLPMA